MTNINCTARVSKYKIYKEDCLGISNSRSLLSSLSNLLARPTIAVVMVDVPILAKQATSARAILAAANPPSFQWQPPSASIITVFFQPKRKYPAARPPTTEPKSQELKVMAMSMRK